ncbi:MAG: T9SS type A sorting domain-containing protein [Janthinobacterium lividum]
MRHTLLVAGSLALAHLFAARLAHSQTLPAGQTTGVVYTDLMPDVVIGRSATSTLDLDNDGRADLQLASYYFSLPNYAETQLHMLHGDVNIVFNPGSPTVASFPVGYIIQDLMPSTTSSPSLQWYTMGAYDPYLTHYGINQGSGIGQYAGSWVDNQDHYMGVRVRASATAPWRYGWVRVQVPDYNAPSMTVKDYALTNAVLATQPALAAGWQIYPTCVTSQLMVIPPAAIPAQLTVRDLCGRAQLHLSLPPTGSQLDLTPLAAGVYVLELETPAGRFSQRISKN